jgi:hypothetical protein
MFRARVLVAFSVVVGSLCGCSDNGTNEAAPDQQSPLTSAPTAPPAPATPVVIPAAVAAPPKLQSEIPLEDDNGTFVVPVTINDTISLKFTIDSGASYVTIPSDVASTLVRAGTITAADYVGSDTFVLADGSEVPSPEFRMKSLRVGNLVLHDVVASITNDRGSLLLGQTFLRRLGNWSIDNNRHVLTLGAADDESASSSPAGDEAVAASTPAYTPDLNSSADAAAERLVSQFFASWSNPSDPDGLQMWRFYGPMVNFYGKQISLAELMDTKEQFARRWPVRTYSVRDGSLRISCSAANVCRAAGVLDWKASSSVASRYSSGTATFSFVLDNGLIIEEHGRVLSRVGT